MNKQNLAVKILLEDSAVSSYLSTLGSVVSIQAVKSYIRSILRTALLLSPGFNWNELNERIVNSVLQYMIREGKAPSTVNTSLCVFKQIANQLWLAGRITDRTNTIIFRIRNRRGSRIAHGRMLSFDEVHSLFKKLDKSKTFFDIRNAAMLAVMATCALRRSEVSALRNENVHLGDNPFLKIIGKGNKERIVPIPHETVRRLAEWRQIRGVDAGWFFVQMDNSENLNDRPLSSQRIYEICKSLIAKTGMQQWSPHDLRRTCASNMIDRGVDLNTVKDFLGHASISTTQLYDKRNDDRLKRAAEAVNWGI